MSDLNLKKIVREGYAKVARENSSCCPTTSCCGSNQAVEISSGIGYSAEQISEVPEGSNLGLGCGNPTAIASLKEGDVVLDLGSGAGFDCFLAAREVGSTGRVIGVDMTPEMLDKARFNAARDNFHNVEFRLGEIENLPIADNTVDVVISNCVINLSTDKPRVFSEIFRVLKPGGRFIISDIVLTEELPERVKHSQAGYVGCISGALLKEEYLSNIIDRGFNKVNIDKKVSFPVEMIVSDQSGQMVKKELHLTQEEISRVCNSILSITVSGVKPQ